MPTDTVVVNGKPLTWSAPSSLAVSSRPVQTQAGVVVAAENHFERNRSDGAVATPTLLLRFTPCPSSAHRQIAWRCPGVDRLRRFQRDHGAPVGRRGERPL